MQTGGLEEIHTVKLHFDFIVIKKFLCPGNGAILVMYAFILPLLLIFTGMITDIGRAFVCRAELNKACMIAAEEASREIDMLAAQQLGSNSLDEKYTEIISYFFYANISKRQNFTVTGLNFEVFSESSNPRYIKVSCEAEIKCFFLQLAGIPSVEIHSSGDGRLKRISSVSYINPAVLSIINDI
jgi:hypothetical protein